VGLFGERVRRPARALRNQTTAARRRKSGATAYIGAQASGNADKFKGFAEECMAEYDLDGWKVPDLSDPGELSYHVMRGAK